MFEAKLVQGVLLKKILEAIKELVTDASFDCSSTGIALQAMDSAHVSLCHMLLKAEGFDHYRCDRNLNLGINMATLSKMLKCVGSDDQVTLRAEDDGDTVSFQFENKDKDRISEFDLKLVEIEGDLLGIPETSYQAVIQMPSSEFQKIVKDLSSMGDTVNITASKNGVKFSVSGEELSGSINVKQNTSVDKKDESTIIELQEGVSLTFALKYLNIFAKATSLAPTVCLSLSKDSPLMVEYKMENIGHIRYYLAPKIDEESEETTETKSESEKKKKKKEKKKTKEEESSD